MTQRIGALSVTITLLSAYAGLIWMCVSYDFVYWNDSEWYGSVITTRGEIYYKSSRSERLFHPDGRQLSREEEMGAIQQGILNEYSSLNWRHSDRELFGYRWRDAWEEIRGEGIYGGPQVSLSPFREPSCHFFPLVDEHTFALYLPEGNLRGRLTPIGFIEGESPVGGFSPDAITHGVHVQEMSFFITDKTGMYKVSGEPPAVDRIFTPSPATYFAGILELYGPSGPDEVSMKAEFISDSEVDIGVPQNMYRIALPGAFARNDCDTRSLRIRASKDFDTIALMYHMHESWYVHLLVPRSSEVLLDTVLPEFHHPSTGQQQEAVILDNRYFTYLAIQPMPIPAMTTLFIGSWLKYGNTVERDRTAAREMLIHGGPIAIALLLVHIAGALAGFLLARCADPRRKVTMFWALIGFFLSIPVILIYPFFAPKRQTIPCRSCGRKLQEPRMCPFCGAEQLDPPLIS